MIFAINARLPRRDRTDLDKPNVEAKDVDIRDLELSPISPNSYSRTKTILAVCYL